MNKYTLVVCLLIVAVAVVVNAQVGVGAQGQTGQGAAQMYPVRRQPAMFPFFPMNWNSLMWLYFMDNGFNT